MTTYGAGVLILVVLFAARAPQPDRLTIVGQLVATSMFHFKDKIDRYKTLHLQPVVPDDEKQHLISAG